jgi:tRNA nucleotidyltransferase/poly(A) polymerase
MKTYLTNGKRLGLTPEEMKERICLQRRAAVKRYAEKNKDKVKIKLKAWRVHRAEHCAMYNAEAYKKNPTYFKTHASKRYQSKKRELSSRRKELWHKRKLATPRWANKKLIKLMYAVAKEMSLQEGIKYTVDHIIPLNGNNVSGLHIETNMQIVPLSFNIKKRSRRPQEMFPPEAM